MPGAKTFYEHLSQRPEDKNNQADRRQLHADEQHRLSAEFLRGERQSHGHDDECHQEWVADELVAEVNGLLVTDDFDPVLDDLHLEIFQAKKDQKRQFDQDQDQELGASSPGNGHLCGLGHPVLNYHWPHFNRFPALLSTGNRLEQSGDVFSFHRGRKFDKPGLEESETTG